MRVGKSIKLDYGNRKTARWLGTADWHIGAHVWLEAAITRCMRKVKRTGMQWVHGADAIDGIRPSDPRYMASEHKMVILDQIATAERLMRIGANTCVGMVAGTHEVSESRDIGNVAEHICTGSGVPYLGYSAFVRIVGTTGTGTLYLVHGTSAFNPKAGCVDRRSANRRISLRRYFAGRDADVCLCGHGHHCIVASPLASVKLGLSLDNTIKLRPVCEEGKWCIMLPSLHHFEDTYAERRGLDPTATGWCEFVHDWDGACVAVERFDVDGKVLEVYEPVIER